METVAISGDLRKDVGKKASKALRKNGSVPCVIYGGENNIHFSSPAAAFKPLIFTPDFKLADVTVDGQTYQCILKDAQYHPVTDEIEHLDFLQLVPGKKVKVNIPIGFKGVSPGVKAGGKLVPKLRSLKIKTTPDKIVNKLFVDISTATLGGSVRVRDVEVNEHMEVMNPGATPVASVEIPRALKSAASKAEATAE
ncbi:MAG: 50S ribosomal protein L25 [Bacteroidota bacterium]